MISQFRHQHDELIHLVDAIIEAAQNGRGDDLASLRLAFARAVKRHVDAEAVVVQKAISRGILCADVVEAHNRLVMLWRGDVALCNSEWPTRRVLETPEGFLRRFRPLADAMRAAVTFEEQQMLAPLTKAA
jgi:hypothetical protein